MISYFTSLHFGSVKEWKSLKYGLCEKIESLHQSKIESSHQSHLLDIRILVRECSICYSQLNHGPILILYSLYLKSSTYKMLFNKMICKREWNVECTLKAAQNHSFKSRLQFNKLLSENNIPNDSICYHGDYHIRLHHLFGSHLLAQMAKYDPGYISN